YRDDPSGYASSGGYYDPYRGPVPQTFHDDSMDGHESIPMNTYPPGSRERNPDVGGRAPGRTSPGPSLAYEAGERGSPAAGRRSPGPGLAYDAGERAVSPGPVAALGMDSRSTPRPQQSGQPEMASRSMSPGPNLT